MMTRGELREALRIIFTGEPRGDKPYGCISAQDAILDHDQAQRAVIDGLSKKVKQLTAWSDKMFGTPCEEIRHQQIVEELEAKIEQQAKEIESLQKCQCEGCDNSLEGEAYCQCCWMKMNQENQALRDALQDVVIRAQRIRENKAIVGIEATFIERVAKQALKDTTT